MTYDPHVAIYKAAARRHAKKYGLDPDIFERQINAESGFRKNAGSGAGAQGIAQIMPGTAKSWGIDPFNSGQALDAAAKHMAEYVKKYGSYDKALRAYNAGEGAIDASHGYAETNNYVNKILMNGRDPGKLGAPSTQDVQGDPGIDVRALSQSNALGVSGTPEDNSKNSFASLIASLNPLSGDTPADRIRATTAALVAQHEGGSDVSGTPGVTAALAGGTPQQEAVGPAKAGKVNISSGANRGGVNLQKPVLGFLNELSGSMGRPVDVTTGTNHNQYVAGEGKTESDHWTGNASDLGMGGDARQDPSVSKKGDLVAAHAIALAGKMPFQKALALARQGGVHNFQYQGHRVQIIWKTMIGGDHFNHVHVGVR